MPRDGSSGLYTLPPGTDAIPNRTILSSPYNLAVHDIETDLNTPRPIIAGGTGASTGPAALAALGGMGIHNIGQCYLSKVGANLVLSPQDGNFLNIQGVIQTIPDAGVVLTPSGAAASTFYYIYAYMNVGVLTLEYSPTAYAVQAGTGTKIKSGDSTRTLVGIWSSAAANVWSTIATEGASYFNPVRKTCWMNGSGGTVGVSTTSTIFAEMTSTYRTQFVTFANREVVLGIRGRANLSVNTASGDMDVGIDGLTQSLVAQIRTQPAAAAGNWEFFSDAYANYFSEARHFVTGIYRVSTGTLAILDTAWYVRTIG
jgi:hypothetical protein